MVIQIKESKSQFNTDLNFYLRSVDKKKIPSISEIREQLYSEYREVDEKNRELEKGTSLNNEIKEINNNETKETVVEEKIKEQNKEQKVDNENKKETNIKVKLDEFDDDGWATYKKSIEEDKEIIDESNFEDDEADFPDDDFTDDLDEDDEADFPDDDFPDDFDDEVEEEEEEKPITNTEKAGNDSDDLDDDFEDDDADFPDEDFEDDEFEDDDADFSDDDLTEEDEEDEEDSDFDDDDFDDFPDDSDFDDDVESDDDGFKEEVVPSNIQKKEKEVPFVKNESSFGGSDGSWRSESEVGDVENLWGFSSMEPMSKDEIKVFTDSIQKIQEKVRENEASVRLLEEPLEEKKEEKSLEEIRRERFKKRLEEKRKSSSSQEDLLDMFSEDEKPVEKSSPAVKEQKVTEEKRVAVAENKGLEEVKQESYATVRDFVKKNPNSSIEQALQYFSKKEVDRELKMGRINLKNKILFI